MNAADGSSSNIPTANTSTHNHHGGGGSGMRMNGAAGLEGLLMPLLGGMHANALLRTFMVVNQTIGTHLGIDPTALVTAMGFVWAVWRLSRQFWSLVWHGIVLQYMMASVSVGSDDEIFDHVMGWLAAQPRTSRSRWLMAETVGGSAWEDQGREYAASSKLVPVTVSEDGVEYMNFSNLKATMPPRYIPALGLHDFWFRHRYFKLDRRRETITDVAGIGSPATTRDRETMVISCFGFSPDPIKELLCHAREHYYKDHYAKTTIKRPTASLIRRSGRQSWTQVANRPVRPMNTVVLDREQKTGVLSDMNEYLHPETPRWYANRGIPLRRGYLFHGPPGTGKTSLSFALAGVFGLDIYVISLQEPQLTEEDLSALFNNLPRRCVVLLEDIDTAGLSREDKDGEHGEVKEEAADETRYETTAGSRALVTDLARALKRGGKGVEVEKKGISLSGLLNAIDGVASHEGRVLIMTTNMPETLDDALIRPGRVDMQVAFSNASQEQAGELFQRMYGTDTPERPSSFTCLEKEREETEPLLGGKQQQAMDAKKDDPESPIVDANELARIATEFGSHIINGQLSPAEIQGFLLKRRKSPRRALRDVEAWVKAMAEQKASKSKVSQVQ